MSTYLSFAALLPCPLFLILDLGRPGRFHNMLRAFRPSSPMSMGTWGLTAFGMISSLTVARQLYADFAPSQDHSPRIDNSPATKALALLQTTTGMFVAGYTGVLLAATAVPLWSKRPALIAPLFLASAMTSSAAVISAASGAVQHLDARSAELIHEVEMLSTAIEGTLLLAWVSSLGPTAKPLQTDLLGYVVRDGVAGAGIAAPLLLAAVAPSLPRRARRAAVFLGSALTLAGVLALRYAVVEGGRRSANDPVATFEMTG